MLYHNKKSVSKIKIRFNKCLDYNNFIMIGDK